MTDPFSQSASSTTNFATNSQKSQKSSVKQKVLDGGQPQKGSTIKLQERTRVHIYKMLSVDIILTKLSKLSQQDRELVRSIQQDREGTQKESTQNWFRIRVPALSFDAAFSSATTAHFKSGYS